MTTKTDITLPPLPVGWDEQSTIAYILRDYARAAVEADRQQTQALLSNPVHVHTNMCRGLIAPITFDMLAHVLGEEATAQWLADRASRPVPSDIDIQEVREYLDQWGCLAHPGVRALLSRYGQPADGDELVDLGGTAPPVPSWVLASAQRIVEYMEPRYNGAWAVGGIQKRQFAASAEPVGWSDDQMIRFAWRVLSGSDKHESLSWRLKDFRKAEGLRGIHAPVAAQALHPSIKEGVEAAFAQREGWQTKIACAVRHLPDDAAQAQPVVNQSLTDDERTAFESALAECRDLLPVLECGSTTEDLWADAMSDPLAVPAYIRAALAQQPSAQDRGDAERMDWICDHATTYGRGDGMDVTFRVPDSEDIRDAIDAARA